VICGSKLLVSTVYLLKYLDYSLMTYKFADNREKYLGMGESAAGLGCMLGPVLGSIFYSYLHYFGAFMIFAGFLAFAAILSFFTLSASLNVKLDVMNAEERAISRKLEAKVPYKWFFSSVRSIFALLTCTYVCLIFSFHAAFFTTALKKEKGVDEFYHGFIVAAQPTFYVLATIVVGYVIHKLPKRVFIAISCCACAIALAIMGPSYYLGFPNSLWILIVGQALQGAALGFVFIPILPEMIDSVYVGQNIVEGDDERVDGIISDKAAGLYGSFYSTGMIISPLLGSLIYEHFQE
jgi:MFS family permease